MRFLLIVLLLLTGCTKETFVSHPYPGKAQGRMHECRYLWDDLHYYDTMNVEKCESKVGNPRFVIGQKVKLGSGYDKSCYAVVISNSRWSPLKNELIYSYKVYCDGKPMHDSHCENGNGLNCPTALETDFQELK